MLHKAIIISLLILSMGVSLACNLTKPVPYGGLDDYGCNIPPESVFTTNGIDISFAQSTFEKVITGDVTFKTNPQVISLASQTVRDAELRTYLRCLALNRDKFTPEQIAYFENLSAILATDPTTKEMLSWSENNPFPVSDSDSSKGMTEKTFAYWKGREAGHTMGFIVARLERFYDENGKYPNRLSELGVDDKIEILGESKIDYRLDPQKLFVIKYAGSDHRLNTSDDKIHFSRHASSNSSSRNNILILQNCSTIAECFPFDN